MCLFKKKKNLTTVAGTKKHGRSAESPNAARRATVQSVPLEAHGDRRGFFFFFFALSQTGKRLGGNTITRLVM